MTGQFCFLLPWQPWPPSLYQPSQITAREAVSGLSVLWEWEHHKEAELQPKDELPQARHFICWRVFGYSNGHHWTGFLIMPIFSGKKTDLLKNFFFKPHGGKGCTLFSQILTPSTQNWLEDCWEGTASLVSPVFVAELVKGGLSSIFVRQGVC